MWWRFQNIGWYRYLNTVLTHSRVFAFFVPAYGINVAIATGWNETNHILRLEIYCPWLVSCLASDVFVLWSPIDRSWVVWFRSKEVHTGSFGEISTISNISEPVSYKMRVQGKDRMSARGSADIFVYQTKQSIFFCNCDGTWLCWKIGKKGNFLIISTPSN